MSTTTPASTSPASTKPKTKKPKNPLAPKKPFFKKRLDPSVPKRPAAVLPTTAEPKVDEAATRAAAVASASAADDAAEKTKLARVRRVCALDLTGHTPFEKITKVKLDEAVAAVQAEFPSWNERMAKKALRKVVERRVRNRKKMVARGGGDEDGGDGRCGCGRLLTGGGRGGKCAGCRRKEGDH